MKIENSTIEDLDIIFDFYDQAVAFQKTKFDKHWKGFDIEMIMIEIAENRQFKLIENNEVVCVFAITHNDPAIWGEKDKDSAVYIHRIVTDNRLHGKGFVPFIIDWAKTWGKENQKHFIRLDTWGDNERLCAYYVKCGFNYVGLMKVTNSETLPAHYNSLSLGLFEIELSAANW